MILSVYLTKNCKMKQAEAEQCQAQVKLCCAINLGNTFTFGLDWVLPWLGLWLPRLSEGGQNLKINSLPIFTVFQQL